MPVSRRATPPTSQIREQLSVLNSLSAWTDTGEEEKAPKKAGYQKLNGGPAMQQDSWKQHMQEWMDPEGDKFNLIIGLTIICNAVCIGLETEYGDGNFVLLEHLFNITFFLEMCLRLRIMKLSYFAELWNVFDFTLVAIGTLDLWVLPVLTSGGGGLHQVTALRMLRMLRLMRVLRVIRLFRMFQKLFLIMQAFGKAFQIVLLMGLLVLILDYVCAIMLTQGIGHQAHKWDGEDRDKIEAWFGSIPNSMQTLFLVMTLTNWDDVSLTLVKQLPAAVVYCSLVLYIMVTSYTMLSLITGIISESLITAQQEYRLRKEKQFEDHKKDISYELRDFLLNEAIDESEKDQHNNVRTPDLKTVMKGDTALLMKLASVNIHMTEQGIQDLIEKLSSPDTGTVNIDYFVDKLTNIVGGATASSIMDLKYDMSKMNVKLDAIMSHLGIAIDTSIKPAATSGMASADLASFNAGHSSMATPQSQKKGGLKPNFTD